VTILAVLGINVSALLVSAGIAGLAVSLGVGGSFAFPG
jgi:small-conductance mechanosensitive channel